MGGKGVNGLNELIGYVDSPCFTKFGQNIL